MKKIDGKEFNCTRCGKCCSWEGHVWLTDEDINNIAEYKGISKEKFLDRYTSRDDRGKIILQDKPGSTKCLFLKDKLCTIYGVRPRQCADYPKRYERDCPGFLKDKEAYMSKYEEAVKRINEKFSSFQQYEKSIINNLYDDLSNNIKKASVITKALDNGLGITLETKKIKIADLSDLFAFDRVDNNKLVHKSSKDFWSIDSDKDGNVFITRLFDNNGEPIKG